jgi:hypothetical protein
MEVAICDPQCLGRFTIRPHAPVSTVSAARFARVLDTAVDGIDILDETACIPVFNRVCEWLFGYAAGEILSRSIKKIIRSKDADEPEDLIPDYVCTDTRKAVGGAPNG